MLETDEVVFAPQDILRLADTRSFTLESTSNFILRAEGKEDIAALLEAALSDWIDFLFVPVPQSFAIYADHDEYTTFYAPSEPALLQLTADLEKAGFKAVRDYRRPSGEYWK